jgi:hypothetical protein
MPQPAESIILPRSLIFAASLWLIGSWILALGLRAPIHPSSASFTPGVQVMLLSIAIGLLIAWPLHRLSQKPSPWPLVQTILDLIVLLALVQIVLWPLRLVTPWPALRTAAIDATLASWTALVGAVIAASIGSRSPAPRALAMLACLAIALLGPALAWLRALGGVGSSSIDTLQSPMGLLQLSPLFALHSLGEGGGSPPLPAEWSAILVVALAAAAAWTVLGLVRLLPQFSPVR